MRTTFLVGLLSLGLVQAQEAPRVVVVGIDGPTQQALGPFGGSYRGHHDDVIRQLNAAGARGIGFDMSFGPNPAQAEATETLARTAAESRAPVVIAVFSSEGVPEPNAPSFERLGVRQAAIEAQAELVLEEGALGDANAALRLGRDPEVEVRTGAWAILEQVGPYKSLVGELAEATGVARELPTEDLPTGVRQDPTTRLLSLETTRALRPQLGDPESVTTVSYVDVLEGRVDPELLRGAIVLVGMTDGQQDVLENPDPDGAPTLDRVPGVYLHAFALERVIREARPSGRRAVQPRVSSCRCGGTSGSAGRGLIGSLNDGQ
ncbi:MAG: CHASE2 domain-containing protein [Planctomycetota bacterium]